MRRVKACTNSYDVMKNEADRSAQSLGIVPKFEEEINHWVKRHFDELGQDERIQDAE